MGKCFVKNCESGKKTFSVVDCDGCNAEDWAEALPPRERRFNPEYDEICVEHFHSSSVKIDHVYILRGGELKIDPTRTKCCLKPGAVPRIFNDDALKVEVKDENDFNDAEELAERQLIRKRKSQYEGKTEVPSTGLSISLTKMSSQRNNNFVPPILETVPAEIKEEEYYPYSKDSVEFEGQHRRLEDICDTKTIADKFLHEFNSDFKLYSTPPEVQKKRAKGRPKKPRIFVKSFATIMEPPSLSENFHLNCRKSIRSTRCHTKDEISLITPETSQPELQRQLEIPINSEDQDPIRVFSLISRFDLGDPSTLRDSVGISAENAESVNSRSRHKLPDPVPVEIPNETPCLNDAPARSENPPSRFRLRLPSKKRKKLPRKRVPGPGNHTTSINTVSNEPADANNSNSKLSSNRSRTSDDAYRSNILNRSSRHHKVASDSEGISGTEHILEKHLQLPNPQSIVEVNQPAHKCKMKKGCKSIGCFKSIVVEGKRPSKNIAKVKGNSVDVTEYSTKLLVKNTHIKDRKKLVASVYDEPATPASNAVHSLELRSSPSPDIEMPRLSPQVQLAKEFHENLENRNVAVPTVAHENPQIWAYQLAAEKRIRKQQESAVGPNGNNQGKHNSGSNAHHYCLSPFESDTHSQSQSLPKTKPWTGFFGTTADLTKSKEGLAKRQDLQNASVAVVNKSKEVSVKSSDQQEQTEQSDSIIMTLPKKRGRKPKLDKNPKSLSDIPSPSYPSFKIRKEDTLREATGAITWAGSMSKMVPLAIERGRNYSKFEPEKKLKTKVVSTSTRRSKTSIPDATTEQNAPDVPVNVETDIDCTNKICGSMRRRKVKVTKNIHRNKRMGKIALKRRVISRVIVKRRNTRRGRKNAVALSQEENLCRVQDHYPENSDPAERETQSQNQLNDVRTLIAQQRVRIVLHRLTPEQIDKVCTRAIVVNDNSREQHSDRATTAPPIVSSHVRKNRYVDNEEDNAQSSLTSGQASASDTRCKITELESVHTLTSATGASSLSRKRQRFGRAEVPIPNNKCAQVKVSSATLSVAEVVSTPTSKVVQPVVALKRLPGKRLSGKPSQPSNEEMPSNTVTSNTPKLLVSKYICRSSILSSQESDSKMEDLLVAGTHAKKITASLTENAKICSNMQESDVETSLITRNHTYVQNDKNVTGGSGKTRISRKRKCTTRKKKICETQGTSASYSNSVLTKISEIVNVSSGDELSAKSLNQDLETPSLIKSDDQGSNHDKSQSPDQPTKKECFVLTCKQESKALFHPPSDSHLEVWQKKLPRRERYLEMQDWVCSDHFSPDMLKYTQSGPKRKKQLHPSSWKLRSDAVPGIFRLPRIVIERVSEFKQPAESSAIAKGAITNTKENQTHSMPEKNLQQCPSPKTKINTCKSQPENRVTSKCFVPGCKGPGADLEEKYRKFHPFPDTGSFRNLWLREIARKTGVNIPPCDSYVADKQVCEAHFEEADHQKHKRSNPLKSKAVPSVFDYCTESCKIDFNKSLYDAVKEGTNDCYLLDQVENSDKVSVSTLNDKEVAVLCTIPRSPTNDTRRRRSKRKQIFTTISFDDELGTKEKLNVLQTKPKHSLKDCLQSPREVSSNELREKRQINAKEPADVIVLSDDDEPIFLSSVHGPSSAVRNLAKRQALRKIRDSEDEIHSTRKNSCSERNNNETENYSKSGLPEVRVTENFLPVCDNDQVKTSEQLPYNTQIDIPGQLHCSQVPSPSKANQQSNHFLLLQNGVPIGVLNASPVSSTNIIVQNLPTSVASAVFKPHHSSLQTMQPLPILRHTDLHMNTTTANTLNPINLLKDGPSQSDVSEVADSRYSTTPRKSGRISEMPKLGSKMMTSNTCLTASSVEPLHSNAPAETKNKKNNSEAAYASIESFANKIASTYSQNQELSRSDGTNVTIVTSSGSRIKVTYNDQRVKVTDNDQRIKVTGGSSQHCVNLPRMEQGNSNNEPERNKQHHEEVTLSKYQHGVNNLKQQGIVNLPPVKPKAVAKKRTALPPSATVTAKRPVLAQGILQECSTPEVCTEKSCTEIPPNKVKFIKVNPNNGKYLITRKNGKTVVNPYDPDDSVPTFVKETFVTPNQGKLVFPCPQEGETIMVVVPNSVPMVGITNSTDGTSNSSACTSKGAMRSSRIDGSGNGNKVTTSEVSDSQSCKDNGVMNENVSLAEGFTLDAMYKNRKALKLPNGGDSWMFNMLNESKNGTKEKVLFISETALRKDNITIRRVLKVRESLNFELVVNTKNVTGMFNAGDDRITSLASLQELVDNFLAFKVCLGVENYAYLPPEQRAQGQVIDNVWYTNACARLCLDGAACKSCESYKKKIRKITQSRARAKSVCSPIKSPGKNLEDVIRLALEKSDAVNFDTSSAHSRGNTVLDVTNRNHISQETADTIENNVSPDLNSGSSFDTTLKTGENIINNKVVYVSEPNEYETEVFIPSDNFAVAQTNPNSNANGLGALDIASEVEIAIDTSTKGSYEAYKTSAEINPHTVNSVESTMDEFATCYVVDLE